MSLSYVNLLLFEFSLTSYFVPKELSVICIWFLQNLHFGKINRKHVREFWVVSQETQEIIPFNQSVPEGYLIVKQESDSGSVAKKKFIAEVEYITD